MMTTSYNLSYLDDQTLLGRLKELVTEHAQHEAQILAHIAEVDHRRLYAAAAYSSMFAYCVDVLHLSEAATFRRITAARAARRFPLLLAKVASGELHLCAIKLLAPHLTEANCEHLVGLATHASKRTLEVRLARLFPREPVRDSVRKLPTRHTEHEPALSMTPRPQDRALPEQATATSDSLVFKAERTAQISFAQNLPVAGSHEGGLPDGLNPISVTGASAAGVQAASVRAASINVLSADMYKIQFTANAALHEQLMRAQELLPARRNQLADVFTKALDLLVDDLERKRFGIKKPPKTSGKIEQAGSRLETGTPATPNTLDTADTAGTPDVRKHAVAQPPSKGVVDKMELVPEPAANTKAADMPSRYISRAAGRAVHDRDGGQCTFTSSEGKRCKQRRGLEFHHLQAFAKGGANTVDNLALRCKAHNLYAAEQDFGRHMIEPFRACESTIAYEPKLLRTRDALQGCEPWATITGQLLYSGRSAVPGEIGVDHRVRFKLRPVARRGWEAQDFP